MALRGAEAPRHPFKWPQKAAKGESRLLWPQASNSVTMFLLTSVALSLFLQPLSLVATLSTTQSPTRLTLANERLYASVNKSIGGIDLLSLDGQNLLGNKSYETPTPGGATGSDNESIGPYLDCYCIPEGSYTPGSIDPTYHLLNGTDGSGTPWGGIVMSERYPPIGQILEQYWFLKDGETGLHTFSRLAYHNITTPFLRNLQEFRTLFRPNSLLWTNLSTNAEPYAPLPVPNPCRSLTLPVPLTEMQAQL